MQGYIVHGLMEHDVKDCSVGITQLRWCREEL
jgi:hypothetical protein